MFKTYIQVSGIKEKLPFNTHNPETELVSQQIHAQHCWEIHETHTLLNILKPGQTLIDVGANIGYYSIVSAARLGKNGRVVSFEPDPQNFNLLLENIKQNHFKQIHAFNIGLSNQKTNLPLYRSADNRGDHRLFETPQHIASDVIALDSGDNVLLERNASISHLTVHCIKIDTQGYEYSIIDGLHKTITANQKHLHMLVEFWPWGLRKNQTSATELLKLLQQYNMNIHILDHVQGGIYSSRLSDLQDWLAEVEDNPDNQGFVNLLLTPSQ